MTTVQLPLSAGITSRSWSLRRLCKALSSACGKFGGGTVALCKTCETWDLNTSLSSSGGPEIPSSTPATISAVGIFFGAKAKFVPFWSAVVSVLFNGLLEMFSTYLSRLTVSSGNEIFDFKVRTRSFFEFSTRLKEHQKAVVNKHSRKSALAEHCLHSGHTISWESSKILRTSTNWRNRRILEAWEIDTCRNPLNRGDGMYLPLEFLNLALRDRT